MEISSTTADIIHISSGAGESLPSSVVHNGHNFTLIDGKIGYTSANANEKLAIIAATSLSLIAIAATRLLSPALTIASMIIPMGLLAKNISDYISIPSIETIKTARAYLNRWPLHQQLWIMNSTVGQNNHLEKSYFTKEEFFAMFDATIEARGTVNALKDLEAEFALKTLGKDQLVKYFQKAFSENEVQLSFLEKLSVYDFLFENRTYFQIFETEIKNSPENYSYLKAIDSLAIKSSYEWKMGTPPIADLMPRELIEY